MLNQDLQHIKQAAEDSNWMWLHPKEVIKTNTANIDGILAKKIAFSPLEHHLFLIPVSIIYDPTQDISTESYLTSILDVLRLSIEHNTHLIQQILDCLGIDVELKYDVSNGIFYRVVGERFEIHVCGLFVNEKESRISVTNLFRRIIE